MACDGSAGVEKPCVIRSLPRFDPDAVGEGAAGVDCDAERLCLRVIREAAMAATRAAQKAPIVARDCNGRTEERPRH